MRRKNARALQIIDNGESEVPSSVERRDASFLEEN